MNEEGAPFTNARMNAFTVSFIKWKYTVFALQAEEKKIKIKKIMKCLKSGTFSGTGFAGDMSSKSGTVPGNR